MGTDTAAEGWEMRVGMIVTLLFSSRAVLLEDSSGLSSSASYPTAKAKCRSAVVDQKTPSQ